MKKIYLVVLLILSGINTFAQDTKGKTFLTFDLAPLVVPPSRISIGVSHQITENVFVGAEIGKSFSESWGRVNEKTEGYNLFQYRLELGYILTPQKKYVHHYLSTDFIGVNHKETLFDSSYIVNNNEENEQRYTYSRIDYHRTKYAFNFNYGMRIFFGHSRKLGVDPKIGLGVNNVKVDFSNARNLKEADRDRDIFGFPSRYRLEGKESTVNINFQIRFFYNF